MGRGQSDVKTDYYAGAAISLIGAFTGLYALNYSIGNLKSIGPGLFPLALSIILIGLGVLIALNAAEHTSDGLDHFAEDASPYPDVKGGAAIVVAILAFIFLTQTLGLVPGTFACVFIAAMGDRDATWIGTTMLSLVITVTGVLVFHYGLKMNLPLFQLQGFSL